MFCPNCGHQIPDDSLFCPDCGQSIQTENQSAQPNAGQGQQPPVYDADPAQNQGYQYQYSVQYTKDTRPMNGMCIAGFVVGIVSMFLNFYGIVGIVALILSAVGLSACTKKNQRGKGFAVAGLVLGIVGVVFGLVSICACSYVWSYL